MADVTILYDEEIDNFIISRDVKKLEINQNFPYYFIKIDGKAFKYKLYDDYRQDRDDLYEYSMGVKMLNEYFQSQLKDLHDLTELSWTTDNLPDYQFFEIPPPNLKVLRVTSIYGIEPNFFEGVEWLIIDHIEPLISPDSLPESLKGLILGVGENPVIIIPGESDFLNDEEIATYYEEIEDDDVFNDLVEALIEFKNKPILVMGGANLPYTEWLGG